MGVFAYWSNFDDQPTIIIRKSKDVIFSKNRKRFRQKMAKNNNHPLLFEYIRY